MLIHYMLGALFLAIACFVIGRLAGHPSLIGRRFNGYRGNEGNRPETGRTGSSARAKMRER